MQARKFLGAVTMMLSTFVQAQEAEVSDWWYEADLSYSEANPDYKPFTNGEGETLHARMGWQNWQAFGRLANAEFQPSGEVAGGTIKDWWALGVGYKYDLSNDWALLLAASAQGLTRAMAGQENKENGHEMALGARWRALVPLQLGLDVGLMDVVIDDWSLNFEARYTVSKPVYLVARLRDYADFDLTYYEVGLGASF